MNLALHLKCLIISGITAAWLVLAFAGCSVGIVDEGKPPGNIPAAALYFRPKEQFWVVCETRTAGLQRCDFYNPDGQSIAFRCQYELAEPLDNSAIRQAWLGRDRELKFDGGVTVECLNREDGPPFGTGVPKEKR